MLARTLYPTMLQGLMARIPRALQALVAFILLVGLLVPAAVTAPPAPSVRAHPALLELARAQPDALVSVIVQEAAGGMSAEALVARLGGRVTKDLHIIAAFAAELPARGVVVLAASPAVRWVSPDASVQDSMLLTDTIFTTWATSLGTAVPTTYADPANILDPAGPNLLFGSGAKVTGAFGGFLAEFTPGHIITRVEVVLTAYTQSKLGKSESFQVIPYVDGAAGGATSVAATVLNGHRSALSQAIVLVDITSARAWGWSDLNSLEIVVDQSGLLASRLIYLDAVGLRVTSAAVEAQNSGGDYPQSQGSRGAVVEPDLSTSLNLAVQTDDTGLSTSALGNAFNQAVRATDVWNEAPYWQGAGVTVAVVDSGSFKTNGLGRRLIGEVNFNSSQHTANDRYGHGTFVAGLVADDGSASGGMYMGIAPRVNVLALRVSDDLGMATESDVVSALQWVYDNKAAYNIRVVNLSLNSSLMQSYHTSPLDAAAEVLWFNGVVVVVSAGNNGTADLYPPANDPFVITAGASRDQGTPTLADDVVATFSAYGLDEAGGRKPDLVAPGKDVIAYLPETVLLNIGILHPDHRVDRNYFRMSGTSMAAPLVSGAAAILVQSNPALTPDQVKYRLTATANTSWPGYNAAQAGAGYLDIYAAVHGATTESANTGLTASQLLWTGSEPIAWGSVNWNSVNWNSVNWNSVNWNSVNWNSVNWNSDYWGP